MELSKRPKGKEIEGFVRDQINALYNLIMKEQKEKRDLLRRDLDLLMAHLKLEFKDVPSVPSKRIIANAEKGKVKEG
jgi:hypothetical protein